MVQTPIVCLGKIYSITNFYKYARLDVPVNSEQWLNTETKRFWSHLPYDLFQLIRTNLDGLFLGLIQLPLGTE
jgi:hypothetical protein